MGDVVICCDVTPDRQNVISCQTECDLMTSPHILDKLFQVFSHWICNINTGDNEGLKMRLRSGSPWANIVPKISAQIASDDKGYWVVIKTGFTLGHCSAAITVHIVSIEHFSYFLGNSTQIRLLKWHTLIQLVSRSAVHKSQQWLVYIL